MTQTRLRLLYSSNAFWATSGYGVQGRSLLPRLAELPEFGGEPGSLEGRKNIGAFFWYGLQGGIHNVDGFTCYPAGNDPYGNDVIGRHAKHLGANIVIPLIDAWVLRNVAQSVAPALFCPWLPIDHDEVPQKVLEGIAGAHLPLTYSKWGHETLTRAGVKNVYIPHGVETSVYRVYPRDRALEFKRWLTQMQHCFLIVIVAANKGFPDRKWFQGQLRAIAKFAEDKPNVRVYIHTEPTPMYGGINFEAFCQRIGIFDKVLYPGHPKYPHIADRYANFLGIPHEYLALVYSAADVLTSCSMSEGFGIPIIEAEACGTPVVVTDFSAMPELVRWGRKVKVADYVWTPMEAFQAWPDVNDMTDKLNELHAEWKADGDEWAIEKREACSATIHAEYDWDVIVRDQWAPLMTRLADEAPPLDNRFLMGGVQVPQTHTDDVTEFVGVLQDGLAQEQQSRPKRRVAPLKQPQELTFEQAHELSKREHRSAREIALEMEAEIVYDETAKDGVSVVEDEESEAQP